MMEAEPPVEYFPNASTSTTTTSDETISVSGDFEFDSEGNFVVDDNSNSPSPDVENNAATAKRTHKQKKICPPQQKAKDFQTPSKKAGNNEEA